MVANNISFHALTDRCYTLILIFLFLLQCTYLMQYVNL